MERMARSRNKQASRLGKTKVKEQSLCISVEDFRLFLLWDMQCLTLKMSNQVKTIIQTLLKPIILNM